MKDDLVKRLLPAILHGDAEHRAWLTEAITAFADGKPVPPHRGDGAKDARITTLTAERDKARDLLVEIDENWRARQSDNFLRRLDQALKEQSQ